MKKIILLAALLLPLGLCAQTQKAADTAYENGRFEEALKHYQTLLSSAQGPDLYKAQLRAVACRYLLGQYQNAAQSAFDFPLPSDPLWQARLLLYRVQTATRVKKVYAAALSDADEENAASPVSAEQWQERIDQSFRQLWALRTKLLSAPLEKETLILDVKDTDLKAIPTLFDFVVLRWQTALLQDIPDGVAPLRAAEVLQQKGPFSLHTKNPLQQVAALLLEAGQLGGAHRADARRIWQAKRILLPFENTASFRFDHEPQQRLQAAGQLEKLAAPDQPAADAPYGRAYAAWQAAELYNQAEEYARAVALCDQAAGAFGHNYYTQSCQELAADIRAPRLNIPSADFSQDPQNTQVSFTARNIPVVYTRLYPLTQEQLKKWNGDEDPRTSWGYLKQVPSHRLPELVKQVPLATAKTPLHYAKPYGYQTAQVKLPALSERGFYAVVFSYDARFDPQRAPLQAVVLNSTDLALFITSGIEGDPADFRTRQNKNFTLPVLRFYTLNLQTGQAQPRAHITYASDWKGPRKQAQSDGSGLLRITQKLNPSKNSNYRVLAPVATLGKSTALAGNVYFNYYAATPFKLFVETDRALYRPGQTVEMAVYGFENTGRGMKTLAEKQPVTLTVRDANYEKIYEKTLPLNAYGSAKDSLTLPETGLLGAYRLEATYQRNGYTARAAASVQVDEYKRPEYEVTLSPAAVLQYNKETTLTGQAKYYFGAPLENGRVSYTVRRSYFRPWGWWWRDLRPGAQELVAQGETTTDPDGAFKIKFTPQPGQDGGFPAQFTVQATVRDDSGRVIETSRTYKASRQKLFFAPSFDKGFYTAHAASVLAQVALTDVNGEKVSGQFTAAVYELENTYTPQEKDGPAFYDRPSAPLEQWFGKNKEVRRVWQRSFSASKDAPAQLEIDPLPEGIYKLKLQAKNAESVELIFLVADKQSKLALPAVAIAQHAQYYPGSLAQVLIGAQALRGPKHLELYQAGQYVALLDQTDGGVSVYTLPVQNAWRDGVSLRWFGASDYRLYQATASLAVPHDDRALSVHMQVPEQVLPGQAVRWQLKAKDARGNAIDGQALVRVYDKALDYYRQIRSALNLDSLFPQAGLQADLSASTQSTYANEYNPAEEKPADNRFSAPQLPQLNLQPRWRAYRNFLFSAKTRGAGNMLMAKEAMPAAAPAMLEAATMDNAVAESAPADDAGAAADPAVRTNFAETAYFNPQLPLVGGLAEAVFTLPQSLTAWSVSAIALTKNADLGSFNAQTLTRKEVMVRLSLPRFWREGDQSTLVAQVSNLSDKKLRAEVTLDLTLDGQEAAAKLGIEQTTQTLTLPANGQATATWAVHLPQGVGLLNVTATVRAGDKTDAEARQLPLLPATARVSESTTAALESGKATLALENLLKQDPTRQVSQVNLRVDPGLLLSVFNAMPQLLKPTYQDALSVANRYVPLAVVQAFYQTYPMLQTAVTKLPRRNTATPAWADNTDPARLLLLEETPWLQTAQGGATREAFLADLFNPASVQKARAQAEKDLAKYQTAAGGYSWMSGGKPSKYITLSILASFAQARRYGGQIPRQAAQKALRWLGPQIEQDLLKSQASADTVALALYAAQVFAEFPQDWVPGSQAPVKKWLAYADQYSAFMTPLGQTYAALAYVRLGDDTKAQNYLDLVLSQLKTDPVTGAYFAPEAQSWLWYKDTLATQTAALRALLEIRPESDKAQGLVQWLLFNRKAQAWDSSAATANAVYALLEYMQRHGLLDDPAQYQLKWGTLQKELRFEPLDWSENLVWTQEAQNVDPQFYTAQVTKRGGLTGFVTLDAVYTTAQAAASPKGVMNLSRRYLLKYAQGNRTRVRALQPGEEIPVGAEVEVQLTLQTDSAFDFVVLTDPKPAGFENTDLTSGWDWKVLPVYREIRDAATNFFIDHVPAGTYTLRYSLRPTLGGAYHALPAQMQSMYTPEFSAHTAGGEVNVK